MKKWIFCLLFLVGCQQLQQGQMQPVKQLSVKENIYLTTCAGAAEGWSDCYQKASQTCNKQYMVIKKIDNNRGTQRDLTFQCKP
jgi:ABC-type uncharacterized transport system ATPase component